MGCLKINHNYSTGLKASWINKCVRYKKSENKVRSLHTFGFNGKENDNEVKGNGNQQDYGFRIYDTRLSRFLSVDPLTGKYPELTPYQFSSNNPIQNIDVDGLEGIPAQAWNASGLRQPYNQAETDKWGYDFIKMYVGALATVAMAVAPIEEVAIAGIAGAVSKSPTLIKVVNAVGFDLKVAKSTSIALKAEAKTTEQIYSRVMSAEELSATQAGNTNFLRGGREGENFFSTPDRISLDAKRTQQRLGLDGKLREYKMDFTIKDKTVEVIGPKPAKPGKSGTSGGGTEYTTKEKTAIKINKVQKLKNTN